jgi:hypothetical protein
VTLLALDPTNTDGAPYYAWKTIARNVKCRVDLTWTPPGMNMFVAEAGRPMDRTGTIFFESQSHVEPGQRIIVTKGPAGTFTVEGQLLRVPGRRGETHHIEAAVTEVAQPLGRS